MYGGAPLHWTAADAVTGCGSLHLHMFDGWKMQPVGSLEHIIRSNENPGR